LPKTIATNQSYEVAKFVSVPLNIIKKILFPIVFIFSLLSKGINKIESKIAPRKAPLITEEELKTLIEVGNKEGTLEAKEKNMLNKIFEFSDLRVRDILKPRTLVASISVDANYDEVVKTFSTSGYSRLPVYAESFDNILGVLHFKEVMFSSPKNKENFSVKKLLKNVCYVPETISAITLLKILKKEKQNLAIVVDEHGSNCGIITMDDILRSVFGRITDNFDDGEGNPVNRIQVINANKFSVPGETRLEDLNSIFSLSLDSEEFDTLGGWLLEQFGSLPSTGEAIRRGNVIYLVEDQAQRRIKSVIITFV
jgi:putative hemolysin